MSGTEILLLAMLLVLLGASVAAVWFLRRLVSGQRGDAGHLARLADTASGLANAQAALEGRLAQMRLGIAVAVEAPAHRQFLGLVDDFHSVDPVVAGDTPHTAPHVSRVIEVDIVRQIVNADPGDRHAGRVTFADGRELVAVREDRVAIDTPS